MSTFEPAKRLANFHLVAQPADLRLNPPESYLYVQYGFIFACGVIYALCYAFYIMRTIKDKTVAGGIEYLYAPQTRVVYGTISNYAIPEVLTVQTEALQRPTSSTTPS